MNTHAKILTAIGIAIACHQCCVSAQSLQPIDASLRDAAQALHKRGDLFEALRLLQSPRSNDPGVPATRLFEAELMATLAELPSPANHLRSTDSAAELRARLTGVDLNFDFVPLNIVTLEDRYQHVLLIDNASNRLYVLSRNTEGTPVLRASLYASIGGNGFSKRFEGDRKTPIGAYRIHKRISGRELPDRYGPIAFVLDYPNDLDRRFNRTGSNIWIHGTERTVVSRPPRSSDGCVVLNNRDLLGLDAEIDPRRALIVLAETITWLPRAKWSEVSARIARAIVQAQYPGHRSAATASVPPPAGSVVSTNPTASWLKESGRRWEAYNFADLALQLADLGPPATP